MFSLDDLLGNEIILDVAAGVSSFCTEANKKGYHVTASDQIYNMSMEEISLKSEQDLDMIINQYLLVQIHQTVAVFSHSRQC